MNESLKKFLNEEQDPKAIEKITAKLNDLLMKNEEIGYIGVQKKPAITVFPDSIVLTNKRIIICKPKNLGLSMDFTDYAWEDISGAFVKENILGSEFSFATKTDIQVSIDYIPKVQARKIYTYAKQQLDDLKNGVANVSATETIVIPETPAVLEEPVIPAAAIPEPPVETPELIEEPEVVEEMETEEVTDFAEIIPVPQPNFTTQQPVNTTAASTPKERALSELSNEELFEKLQNYKKLLDNGLILQGEYDALKKEILSYM